MKTQKISDDVARRIVAAARRGKLKAGYLREALEALEARRARSESMVLVWPRKHGQWQAEDLLAHAVEPSGILLDSGPTSAAISSGGPEAVAPGALPRQAPRVVSVPVESPRPDVDEGGAT